MNNFTDEQKSFISQVLDLWYQTIIYARDNEFLPFTSEKNNKIHSSKKLLENMLLSENLTPEMKKIYEKNKWELYE